MTTPIFDGLLLQCLVERDLEAMRTRGPAALELLLRGFLASPGGAGSEERGP
ncbi:MAG: hypothetical protein HY720_07465 [Planctomycetes bacterium]|nr:hypothetical protein [Planctomycetota bacterium]